MKFTTFSNECQNEYCIYSDATGYVVLFLSRVVTSLGFPLEIVIMAVASLSRALRSLSLSWPALLPTQTAGQTVLRAQTSSMFLTCSGWRGFLTTSCLEQNRNSWKQREKYTVRPIGMKKTGGRDHSGRVRTHGIGGGHKQRYRWIDFQRLRNEPGREEQTFEERVMEVRYDPCRYENYS
ncbi:unnamed protein product [Oncorhynchus mykiss]|uniref:Large ribosomal subunit protein uL2 RNA-binding domain-containing protein n=1 Tax=Oncorhynchus mykiss TaxID=8022 RepID=A0A060XQQ6_ONCMY|nr:unnamed protein product [Oncorhynchus mykiss]